MARGKRERGQSLTELAIFLPVVIVLLLGIGDLARAFVTMITIESAAREAADWGAYRPGNWDTAGPQYPTTVSEMERRARTAASSLPDYRPPDDPDGTNLTFECFFGPGTATDPCSPPTCDPLIDAAGCESYRVRVKLTYQFDLVAPTEFLLLPATFTFERESTFALGKDPGGTP